MSADSISRVNELTSASTCKSFDTNEKSITDTIDALINRVKELEKIVLEQASAVETLRERELPSEEELVKEISLPSKTNKSTVATSRRKLLTKLGLTAASMVAASAATFNPAASNTAEAASGDILILGNSNLVSDTTYLSQTGGSRPADGSILWTDWNPNGKTTPPTTIAKAGIAATSSEGIGGYFQGNLAPIQLAPAGSTGAPTTDAHNQGELFIDNAGNLFLCQASGTPGSWVQVNGSGGSGSTGSNYVTLNPSTRQSGNIDVNGTVQTSGGFRAINQYNSTVDIACGLSNGADIFVWDAQHSKMGYFLVTAGSINFNGGSVSVSNNLYVNGTLSSGSKSFIIPHPDPAKTDKYDLRHCSVEAPSRGETLYRFKVSAKNEGDVIKVILPDYWAFLNENPQVWVTASGHFGRAYGEVNSALTILSITCEQAGEYNVLLIGTRKDEVARAWWDENGVERQIEKEWVSPDPQLQPSANRTKEAVRAIKNNDRKDPPGKK